MQRSERMSRVRARDTKPELQVRGALHARGYRYRLHVQKLPGKPDMVFPARRKVIFVHGCFWHRHEGCLLARMPKSRLDFWMPKLDGNRARDSVKIGQLRALGWDVLVVWECELRHMNALIARVVAFLDEKRGEKE